MSLNNSHISAKSKAIRSCSPHYCTRPATSPLSLITRPLSLISYLLSLISSPLSPPLSLISYLLSIILTLSSCATADEPEAPVEETIAMPVSITIPAGEGIQTRVPGDPGLSSSLQLPRYAYIYLIYKNTTDGTGPDVVNYTPFSLDADKWEKQSYSGGLATSGDEVWRYTGDLSISLPATRSNGRIYAAVSYAALTLSNPNSENEVKDLTFNVGSDELKAHLSDLYSTPYNYNGTGSQYYGIISGFTSKVPSVDLMLYHVASKVDIIWNVAPTVQSSMSVTSLTATGLKQANCFLFKPTENTWTAGEDTYERTFATDEGSKWLGRTSFYTIPYQYPTGENAGKFDVNLRFVTTTANSNGYQITYRKNMAAEKSTYNNMNIFVPWLRGQVQFNTTVTDGGQTTIPVD